MPSSYLFYLGLFLGSFSVLGMATSPPVEEIVRKADEARGPSGEVSFRVEVKDYNGDNLLHTNTYHVDSKGGKYVWWKRNFRSVFRGESY